LSILPNTVEHVLGTSDASFTNTGKEALGEAKAAFQTLLVMAQDRLEVLSHESMTVFVMEAKIYKTIQSLKTCRTDLQTESVVIRKIADDYQADLMIAFLDLKSAQRKLSDKIEEMDVRPPILPTYPLILY
jgi:glycerol-3-phosphate cytidylyltransferase-like family protein